MYAYDDANTESVSRYKATMNEFLMIKVSLDIWHILLYIYISY